MYIYIYIHTFVYFTFYDIILYIMWYQLLKGYAPCCRPQGVFSGAVSGGFIYIQVFDFQYEYTLRKHGLSIP